MNSLSLMRSLKQARSDSRQAFFPGAHLCNGITAAASVKQFPSFPISGIAYLIYNTTFPMLCPSVPPPPVLFVHHSPLSLTFCHTEQNILKVSNWCFNSYTRLGYGLWTLNTLSQVTGYPSWRVSIYLMVEKLKKVSVRVTLIFYSLPDNPSNMSW